VKLASAAVRTASPWHIVWTFARTDFKARYYGTLAGFLWALLKPAAMFLVLMRVFAIVFKSEPDYEINLVIGLFLHDFFADGTKTGLTSLQSKAFLVTRAQFPTWIVVATSVSNALATLVVFAGIVIAYITLRHGLPPTAIVFPLYLVLFTLIVIGISMATSVLFLRYRDLNQVWEVVLQAGFFLAPIVYPLGIIPHKYHFYLYLWPVTPVIDFSRAVLVAGELPSLRAHVFLIAETLVIFAVGVAIYRRMVASAMERL
jgi:lipopolysaccharide transport system permease protein